MLNLLQAVSILDIPQHGRLPVRMHTSDGTAYRLVKHGSFGSDLIRFPAGGCVPDHTHVGDHILYVLGGSGFVDYDGEPWPLEEGVIYLIPGMIRHAIRATTELTLLAIGNEHRDAAAEDRLNVVAKPATHNSGFETVGGAGRGGPPTFRAASIDQLLANDED